jgi:penicillin V acylase-like amidase (Ntn superfamily)
VFVRKHVSVEVKYKRNKRQRIAGNRTFEIHFSLYDATWRVLIIEIRETDDKLVMHCSQGGVLSGNLILSINVPDLSVFVLIKVPLHYGLIMQSMRLVSVESFNF